MQLTAGKQRFFGSTRGKIVALLRRASRTVEDLAFSYLESEEYQELSKRVTAHREEREKDIQNVIDTLTKRLKSSGIQSHIEGRPKHLYSIWQKMR